MYNNYPCVQIAYFFLYAVNFLCRKSFFHPGTDTEKTTSAPDDCLSDSDAVVFIDSFPDNRSTGIYFYLVYDDSFSCASAPLPRPIDNPDCRFYYCLYLIYIY